MDMSCLRLLLLFPVKHTVNFPILFPITKTQQMKKQKNQMNRNQVLGTRTMKQVLRLLIAIITRFSCSGFVLKN